jgi:hypothetical protein
MSHPKFLVTFSLLFAVFIRVNARKDSTTMGSFAKHSAEIQLITSAD